MKKIFSILLTALILMPTISHAAILDAVSKRIHDSSGNLITNLAVANGATIYTEPFPVIDNVGYSSILVIENKSGGAGNIAISPEYSIDGTNFYTVYTTSSGTLTAESAVVSSLANQTRWIQHTSRLAKFVRYKIVAAADSQVTFNVIYQRTH